MPNRFESVIRWHKIIEPMNRGAALLRNARAQADRQQPDWGEGISQKPAEPRTTAPDILRRRPAGEHVRIQFRRAIHKMPGRNRSNTGPSRVVLLPSNNGVPWKLQAEHKCRPILDRQDERRRFADAIGGTHDTTRRGARSRIESTRRIRTRERSRWRKQWSVRDVRTIAARQSGNRIPAAATPSRAVCLTFSAAAARRPQNPTGRGFEERVNASASQRKERTLPGRRSSRLRRTTARTESPRQARPPPEPHRAVHPIHEPSRTAPAP